MPNAYVAGTTARMSVRTLITRTFAGAASTTSMVVESRVVTRDGFLSALRPKRKFSPRQVDGSYQH